MAATNDTEQPQKTESGCAIAVTTNSTNPTVEAPQAAPAAPARKRKIKAEPAAPPPPDPDFIIDADESLPVVDSAASTQRKKEDQKFQTELAHMMYGRTLSIDSPHDWKGFGDSQPPLPECVTLVEEMIYDMIFNVV